MIGHVHISALDSLITFLLVLPWFLLGGMAVTMYGDTNFGRAFAALGK